MMGNKLNELVAENEKLKVSQTPTLSVFARSYGSFKS